MSLISTWSTVANANGTLGSTPFYWPEGQAPSTVNDCAREMMATIRTQWNDAVWFNWGYTVTRVSGTSFSVVTASWNTVTLPAAFEANGRIKLYDTSTIYGTITTVSASAASTLVTFTPDAFSLTASFSSVANSIIPASNTPIPGLNIPTNVITQQTQQIFGIDLGAANVVAFGLSPALTSYVTGQMINFKAAQSNTGPMTMNVDSLGAIPIKKQFNTDMAAGDVTAGQVVSVIYNGSVFELQTIPTNNGTGGSLVHIASNTVANAASIEFVNIFSTAYYQYLFLFSGITPVNNNVILKCQLGIGAGPTYITANYNWGCNCIIAGTSYPKYNVADDSVTFSENGGTYGISNSGNYCGQLRLEGTNGQSNVATGVFNAGYITATTPYAAIVQGSWQSPADLYTSIKFFMSAGNINSTIDVYGILPS